MLWTPAHIDIVSSTDVKDIPIGASATVYSKAFELKGSEFFAICYQVTSSGTVEVTTIQLEQSWTLPSTEGSADTTNYVIPTNMADIHAALADTTAYIKVLNPVCLKYGRIKIVTGSGNTATNTIRMRLSSQERV